MDSNRFDALTKSLTTPDSRRGILKRCGTAIAASLAGLGLGQAGAAPGGQGKGKGKGESGGDRCGGPGQPCKWNTQCCGFAELVCMDGACTECPGNFCAATGSCVSACTDPQIYDPETCACTCPPQTCPSGYTLDPERCVCTRP